MTGSPRETVLIAQVHIPLPIQSCEIIHCSNELRSLRFEWLLAITVSNLGLRAFGSASKHQGHPARPHPHTPSSRKDGEETHAEMFVKSMQSFSKRPSPNRISLAPLSGRPRSLI